VNKKYFLSFIISFLLVSPLFIFAVNCPPGQTAPCPDVVSAPVTFNGVVDNIKSNIIGILLVISSVFTTVMFILTGFKYLTAKGDPSKVAEANKALVWAIAGVAVLVIAGVTDLIKNLVKNLLGI